MQSQASDTGPAPEVVPADASTGTTVKTDAHKNVQKKVGEKAGLIDEKTKENYFTIEVTNATLASECTPRVGSAPLAPTRSIFLILDINATLAADVADKVGGDPEESYMPLVAETFSVATEQGTPDRNVTSETAWGCFDDSVLLPPVVNPGQTVTGKLVLAVEVTQGRVAYDPQENGGWSWPYGD
ncbi:hypothetical protein [Paeniglutamicibacter gangotriensis]|uniref:hypothetical protein n=1 Tax=Paeniglutamicibacter gangotriensis TaxID=254787 RepID=UPI0012679162|nr:hypothetical protein [Paeniglutamicibacter gangotriensis]